MSPSSEAIAFRIWAFAAPIGWDATMQEVAEHLGISEASARAIVQAKGWTARLRKRSRDTWGRGGPVPTSWGEGRSDREIINHIEREFAA